MNSFRASVVTHIIYNADRVCKPDNCYGTCVYNKTKTDFFFFLFFQSKKEDQRAAEKLQRKKDAWRRKHEALVRNVRNARLVQQHLAAGGNLKDLPPELNATDAPDDEADSDLVKCPHCGRTFNEASAERHVPLCAERQRDAAVRLKNKKR